MTKPSKLDEVLSKNEFKQLTLPVFFLSEENEMTGSGKIKRVVPSNFHKSEFYLIQRPYKPLVKF